jgi:3,4-dihydroxy 2-butanone 4-phosphate synthase/GTP cyclohydrolase II
MTMSTGLPESDGRASSTFEMNGGHEDRGFARIGEAIEAIGRGEIVIVVDDEDRENEGDLIMAAEKVTTEDVVFFLHHTSGFLCTAITTERARTLRLDPMVADNTESMNTAFLVSVDHRVGTSTGIRRPPSEHSPTSRRRRLISPVLATFSRSRHGRVEF